VPTSRWPCYQRRWPTPLWLASRQPTACTPVARPALAVAFGSNRLLFTGPVGVMTVLVLGSLHRFAEPFSAAYVELAASLTLMVGMLSLLLAVARLGFLVRAIPTPVTEGFIAGAALLIIGTQVGHALGAPPPTARPGVHLPAFLAEAAEAWSRRDILVPALSATCITIALLARRVLPGVPEALTVVVLSLVVTFALGLRERGVEMVGALPTQLPPVSAPALAPLLSGQLWASAALLTLVGMMETCSISRFVARRTGQRSDPGREAVGQGLANLTVAFVGGYPVCASLSGTSVNLAGGACGPRPIYFFTALALLAALCLGPLFAHLPSFALAAVVILAVSRLLDPRRLMALCRTDRLDGLVALATFIVTLLVGPERGVLAGVAAAPRCATFGGRGACRSTSACGGQRACPAPTGLCTWCCAPVAACCTRTPRRSATRPCGSPWRAGCRWCSTSRLRPFLTRTGRRPSATWSPPAVRSDCPSCLPRLRAASWRG
jgi:sulfate permease, SulP family